METTVAGKNVVVRKSKSFMLGCLMMSTAVNAL